MPTSVSANIASELNGVLPWPECLDQRRHAPDAPVVYVIWTDNPFPRLVGQSNIIYVGSTLRLGGSTDGCRLYSYRFSPQPHSKDMRERTDLLVKAGRVLSLRWAVVPNEESARLKERAYLKEHLREHLEFPPFNRRR
jgi:hypothetical protein